MAKKKNTNPVPAAKSAAIEYTTEDLEIRLPSPNTAHEALMRDVFLWPGTAANAALAELALREREGRGRIVREAIDALEASVMYKRLDDEAYRTADADSTRFVSSNHSAVLRDARLFAAGRLAERRDREERKRRKRKRSRR